LKALVEEHLAGLTPVVCANLPYNITSPLIAAFLDAGCFESLTLMVQREVAQRICARAGTSDYGAFTVYVNWHAEPEILFDVSPDCFMPQPKVWSSVIRLKVRKAPPVAVRDEKLFFAVVRAAFNQRRKTLHNALSSGLAGFSREAVAAAIAACGLDALIRGEALDLAGFAAVADALSADGTGN
jgi:16S rRNA (adenine1518-N6/adenine1519-N6)-dimethyltransferase